jgi:hypothetical protein
MFTPHEIKLIILTVIYGIACVYLVYWSTKHGQ